MQAAESVIEGILMGEPADDAASRDALANPQSLDWFVGLAARRRSPEAA